MNIEIAPVNTVQVTKDVLILFSKLIAHPQKYYPNIVAYIPITVVISTYMIFLRLCIQLCIKMPFLRDVFITFFFALHTITISFYDFKN